MSTCTGEGDGARLCPKDQPQRLRKLRLHSITMRHYLFILQRLAFSTAALRS
ncbi:MAG: hypothetical protein K9N48_02970 [Verrucomicrobia bacterium]|nr:hypothetical protein [Verrucomicrobiota bacterium]MCF7709428.1 hypothetical protein [Verrucomicrobiota bacterium]